MTKQNCLRNLGIDFCWAYNLGSVCNLTNVWIADGDITTAETCALSCPTNYNITYPLGKGATCGENYNNINVASYDGNSYTCTSGFLEADNVCFDNTNDANDNGALLYTGLINSTIIDIPLKDPNNNNNPFQNYYYEIWFYAARSYVPYCLDFNTNYYIFVSSGLSIFRKGAYIPDDDDVYIVMIGNNVRTSDQDKIYLQYKYEQWHKIAYTVSYSAPNYSLKFFANKSYEYDYLNTIQPLSLSSVSFCNNAKCGQFTSNIFWYSGYYKFMRVWSTALFDVNQIQNLDR
jgi:hypothetical protein